MTEAVPSEKRWVVRRRPRPRCGVRRVAAWLMGVACSCGGSVSAEPAPEVRETPLELQPARIERALIEQGIALRKAEDDRGARAAFSQAWDVRGSPEALGQLALAEQALGLWVEAHEHLRAALDQSRHSWIIQHRATLEASLAEMESRFGRLEVSCNVAAAEVSMDGRVIGRTPLAGALHLLAGRSVIRVSAAGHFDVTRQVQIDAGALSRLAVVLTPNTLTATSASAAAGPRGPGDDASGSDDLAPGNTSAMLAAEPRTGVSDVRGSLEYASLGLAALGVAAGVTGYVIREVNVNHYNDDSRCNVDPVRTRTDECPSAATAWRWGESLAIGGFAAAGVFGGVGLYLLLAGPSGRDLDARGCGVGFGSVTCSGRF